jgi:hypothetical protein
MSEEPDIHPPKLLGAGGGPGGCRGVFPWTKKEEKGNDDEIRNCCANRRTFLSVMSDDDLDGPHRER